MKKKIEGIKCRRFLERNKYDTDMIYRCVRIVDG
jgi:hypothetical protein